MSVVIDLAQRRAEKDAQDAYEQKNGYWGLCPMCRRTDGFLNVGADHWFTCDAHKACWCVGSNLFSGWRDEPESQHKANAAKLESYKIVEPYQPVMRDVGVIRVRHAPRDDDAFAPY